MKLTRLFVVTLIFTIAALNCGDKKNANIPTPVAPPPIPKPAEPVKEDPKPVVEVDDSAENADEMANKVPMLEDIYFEFDKSNLREDARETLNRYAEMLKANPGLHVLIEGHCDERGTEDYNLALGERRAQTTREYLTSLGVDESRMRTISYGELRPKTAGSNEDAWAQNRRAHFVLSR